jgi:alkylation response protein AidB-like acyl-CoA dehydrogenase
MGFDLQGSRLGYSDAQLELMDSLHGLLEEHCPASLVRSLIEDSAATEERLWQKLAEAGWTSSFFPEEIGGQGLSFLDTSALLVEAGRVLLPGPFLTSAVLTPLALSLAPQARLAALPGIAEICAGQRVAALALAEAAAPFPSIRVEATVQDGLISGVKRFVLDAGRADVLLVLAKNGSGAPVLAWVPASVPEIKILAHPTIDGRRVCTVTLDRAAVAGMLPLPGWQSVRDLMLRAAVLVASLQLGGAESALALAVAYAQTRVQFGRPIGAFQAVGHRLVDLYCNLAVGRALVQKAARLVDDETFPEAASRAKIWINDTYRAVAKGALQTFGGIGFTFDHDIHLYLRTAYALAAEFGSSADHRRLLRASAVPGAQEDARRDVPDMRATA